MALQQVKDVGNTSHSHRHPFHRFVSSLGLHLGTFLILTSPSLPTEQLPQKEPENRG